MPSVNWGTSTLQFTGAQRVYVRQRWADAWVLQPNIWCSSLTWTLLPSIPTAELSLEYGSVIQHGTTVAATQAKIDIAGWFIKVEVDAADGTLSWYGFIDEIVDEQGGITAGIPSGTLRWVAYGMIQILAHAYFTRSRWFDEPWNRLRWSGSAITFNDEGKPNRTVSVPQATGGDEEDAATHVFAPRAPDKVPGTGASPWSPNTHWSSRDIIDYIKHYAAPLDQDDAVQIPIAFVYPEVVPDWDKPTVQTEGRSVLDVLNELVNASKLMQISSRVTSNTLELVIHSLAESAIPLADDKTHPANVSQLTLVTWAAQDTNVVLQESLSRRAIQVVVKGAKRQSLVTVQVAINKTEDKGLIEAFDDFDRLNYDRGASTLAAYAAMSTEEKKEANQRVRAQAKVLDTYKTFAVNPYWSFWIDADPIFPIDDGLVPGQFLQHFPYWGLIRLVDRLPLKELFDYDQAVPITTIPFAILAFEDQHLTKYRKPFVLFERPTEMKYIDAEKMANGVDPKFSCYTGLSKEDQAITLDVTGAYQHAIAYSRFNPLPVDESNGEWDYVSSYFTIALQEDRFLESIYPAVADLPEVDIVRRRLIYAGEAYERVYVAADTVYDVKDDGSLRKINGGTAVTHFRNDQDALDSVCRIAAFWHGTSRKVLRLISARPSATPLVGQIVTTLNAGTAHANTVNTVISEISLQMQRGANLPIATAEYSLVTALGELDPLAFAPRKDVVA